MGCEYLLNARKRDTCKPYFSLEFADNQSRIRDQILDASGEYGVEDEVHLEPNSSHGTIHWHGGRRTDSDGDQLRIGSFS
jgi:hypothetical protein